MKLRWLLTGAVAITATAATASFLTAGGPPPTTPTKNYSLQLRPGANEELWVVNQDNDAVIVANRKTGAVIATIPVGMSPRNIAFDATGSKAFVTNQRGNVDLDKTFREYDGSEILGSISVIDTTTKSVSQTLTTNVGTEPFGIALAPNGKYMLVTNHRSDSLSVLDPATETIVASMKYVTDLNFPPLGVTIADMDTNDDLIADLEGPRGIAIAASSDRAFITHLRSGFVSVVALTLDGNGIPTSLSVAKRINLNKYAFDNFFNPTPITEAKSQGNSKFLEDITISPDGTRAWLGYVLHNVNHDVNVPFAPDAFANRVYPVVSVIDLTTETFEWGDPGQTDGSNRIQFDWNVQTEPTTAINYGLTTGWYRRRPATLRASNEPALGTTLNLVLEHGPANRPFVLLVGRAETSVPMPGGAVGLIKPAVPFAFGSLDATGKATVGFPIPNDPSITDDSVYFQAVIDSGINFTNGVRAILGPANEAIPANTLPVRLGHPSRVEISHDGRRALVLSRGSEDIAVFDISGASPKWMGITPRRDSTPSATQKDKNHTPFSTNRFIGDRPTGLLLGAYDGVKDEVLAYVNNEISRDLSVLRINYSTGVVGSNTSLQSLVPTANDLWTEHERIGSEIFEDASRAQTTGDFNNSCASCHFEGGEDGSVWARDVGPRSTIAMYGGIRRTGALLWKAGRMHLGETGPMFGGENGGTGIFTDDEQEALIAFAEKLPVPLNPNLVNAGLTPEAQFGRDIFFGLDDTGLNPTFRHANCFSCHTVELPSGDPAWFTNDQIKILDSNFDQAHQDPCFVLKESFMGESIQDVNSGVNLEDEFGVIIVDRNLDGISDIETYTPMNIDKRSDFTRDDPNSVMCSDPIDPLLPLVFTRPASKFNVPTKMGVLFTGPYFHDHAVLSLRSTVDPVSQTFPVLNKLRNTQHDMRGTNVQSFLSSTNVDADIDALLRFIRAL